MGGKWNGTGSANKPLPLSLLIPSRKKDLVHVRVSIHIQIYKISQSRGMHVTREWAISTQRINIVFALRPGGWPKCGGRHANSSDQNWKFLNWWNLDSIRCSCTKAQITLAALVNKIARANLDTWTVFLLTDKRHRMMLFGAQAADTTSMKRASTIKGGTQPDHAQVAQQIPASITR